MLLACSHLVIATTDVPRMTRFFSAAFGLEPHFANDLFAEFVLSSRFRVAFFVPVGKSARSFDATASRGSSAFGVTVDDVEATYETLIAMTAELPIELSGPPKEHPWGEKSFLLTDPDGNRWEIAQTPSADGMLVDHRPRNR
jgi:catechol 2,3-dioxygenase-like lactoylglutathione lyase family enzyme